MAKTRSDVELLAELERELVEMQTAIAFLKRRVGGGSAGTAVPGHAQTANQENGGADEKPYLGLSVLDAARKYLQRVREPKTPTEISQALSAGGVHSRSGDFGGIVRTTLFKRGHERGIEKFGGGKWGLRDWRPGGNKGTAENDSPE